ncbi:hypothetical protein CFR73_10265 [Novacetimonas maltaceti]|nr:hypothetical protein CFR73_10265 [Novacetimonas maltaceti]
MGVSCTLLSPYPRKTGRRGPWACPGAHGRAHVGMGRGGHGSVLQYPDCDIMAGGLLSLGGVAVKIRPPGVAERARACHVRGMRMPQRMRHAVPFGLMSSEAG